MTLMLASRFCRHAAIKSPREENLLTYTFRNSTISITEPKQLSVEGASEYEIQKVVSNSLSLKIKSVY